ncbi:phosphatidylserine decarboxylase [Microbacterium sp. NPDC019599]|uniref:phosphatidylserine decarboxylase n=1 Tax=Microbacterium sp. NPDC019599 TaxID=3154690 RepID=UPI0033F2A645
MLALWIIPLVMPAVWLRLVAAIAAAAALSFFRDPEREPEGAGFLAAADGLIRDVAQQDDGRWLVSTYLSLRDVHVTRSPVDADILAQDYRRGAHRAAFGSEAHRNERLAWRLETEHGALDLVQYSGAVARRIVPYKRAGARVERGARIGLIRFGSRVDVTLPAGVVPLVTVGVRVRAGSTAIAAVPRS